jgi:GNAT superfamily N-acetyltransferase
MTDVVLLDCKRERGRFAHLTYPRFGQCLTEPGWPIVAIGAVANGRPVGLALVLVAGVTGRLLSLNVEPVWRQRGLGTALLAACEVALAWRGAIEITATHSSRTVARAAFERTLAAARWEPTELTGLRVSARCGAMLNAVSEWPSMRRLLARSDYRFAPWTDPDQDDREAIERLSRQQPCRDCPALTPKMWPDAIESATSLVLRRGKRLVGWVISERQCEPEGATPSIHYTAAYADTALWHTAIMMAAYYHAFIRQAAAFGPMSVARFETSRSIGGMFALIRRRLAPLALSADQIFVTRRRLNGGDADPRLARRTIQEVALPQ